MAKVFVVPPVPGVKDLVTLLGFLAEQEVFEQHMEELVGLREECVTLINKVGDANEIDSLKRQAESLLEVAKSQVATSNEQAIQRRKQAEAEAKEHLDKAVKQSQEVAQMKADLERKQDLFIKESALKNKILDDQEAELKARLASAKVAEAAALVLKADYEAKVKKLNEAMGL